MEELIIRQEKENDHSEVFKVIEVAFAGMEHADGNEHFIVGRLRESDAFVPELSLVAEFKGRVVGQVLLTRAGIVDGNIHHTCLVLGPLSVLPGLQGRGIGGMLIREAHRIAAGLGFRAVVLVGHEHYYPRFGYERSSKYGIRQPIDVPDENSMAISLVPGGLEGIRGIIKYPEAFGLG